MIRVMRVGRIDARGVLIGREDKTKAEALKDGWLHTGDMGKINPEDGLLYFVDGKKDIIKGGARTSPP